MSLQVDIKLTGLGAEQFAALEEAIRDKASLHARLAGDAEIFVKKRGVEISKVTHRTAERLGATPTGHLAVPDEAVEGTSDEASAALLIPRASRLRAAFGAYRILPKNARFLTIPLIAEAYGRRAREFENLEFSIELIKFPDGGSAYCKCLVKKATKPPVVMFLLTRKADIPEQRNLFPFDELEAEARDSAEAYFDEAVGRTLQPS